VATRLLGRRRSKWTRRRGLPAPRRPPSVAPPRGLVDDSDDDVGSSSRVVSTRVLRVPEALAAETQFDLSPAAFGVFAEDEAPSMMTPCPAPVTLPAADYARRRASPRGVEERTTPPPPERVVTAKSGLARSLDDPDFEAIFFARRMAYEQRRRAVATETDETGAASADEAAAPMRPSRTWPRITPLDDATKIPTKAARDDDVAPRQHHHRAPKTVSTTPLGSPLGARSPPAASTMMRGPVDGVVSAGWWRRLPRAGFHRCCGAGAPIGERGDRCDEL